MPFPKSKGSAKAYGDFYKSSGATPANRQSKLEQAASSSSGVKPETSSFSNRSDVPDDEIKKKALKRRLAKLRKRS